jgi:hypothetical protein
MITYQIVHDMVCAVRAIDQTRVAEKAATEGVMRAWTRKCSMRMQAVLAASIRGCDGLRKTDPSKRMVWALRYHILNPSCEPEFDNPLEFSSFMGYGDGIVTLHTAVNQFLDDLDPYPFHFIQHLSHAAHILAVYHESAKVAHFWREVYSHIIIEGMHALPEPDTAMLHRLRGR